LIIAAVMAARVTPLHQEMAAGERDEGEIARPPQQLEEGNPPEELNNCSETQQDAPNRSIFDESKSTQEETVIKTKESVIEPDCQAPLVEVSSWAKGSRGEVSLGDKLKRLTGLSSLTDLPGRVQWW